MKKVGPKFLVLTAILTLTMTACSSSPTESDPAQSGSASQESKQRTVENTDSQQDQAVDISSDDDVSDDDNASQLSDDGESGEEKDTPGEGGDSESPQSATESATSQSEPSGPSSPEPQQDQPAPEPTSEPDVIPFVTAQEESSIVGLQQGQQYSEGTLVGSADIGIAFNIPQGWTGVFPQDSAAFLLGSETRPGLVIMTSQMSNSVDEIVQTLSQPLPLDQGVVLIPNGQPTVNGPWVEVQATAVDGVNQFDGYVMALVRDSGTGVFIAAIGPNPVEDYQRLASEIAASTRAMKTTVASDQSESAGVTGSDSTALAREWTEFLSGMRATYLSTYSSGSSGGFSDKLEFDFCSNGQFAQRGNSSLSLDTGGASAFSGGTSGGSGTWKIVTQGDRVILELNWSDGSVGQALLQYIDRKTYIDGERYFITPDNTTCP